MLKTFLNCFVQDYPDKTKYALKSPKLKDNPILCYICTLSAVNNNFLFNP